MILVGISDIVMVLMLLLTLDYDNTVLRARRNEKEMKVKPATSFKLLTIFIPHKKKDKIQNKRM